MSVLAENMKRLLHDSRGYVPFAVIGIFVVLGATFMSVYFMQMDYEIAQIIYNTEKSDPACITVQFASADLSRCLNYAGMEALQWQGQHPIIQPVNTSAGERSIDDFIVTARTQKLETMDTLQVSIQLPADVWYMISSLWKDRDIVLIVKDPSSDTITSINYGAAVSSWSNISFEEVIMIPQTTTTGFGSIELECGGELKASNWYSIGMDPVKDITATRFNELISQNYQYNDHRFGDYAINIEPDITPSQITIDHVNGTLERQLKSTNSSYQIYDVFTIRDLNYTLVNLGTNEMINGVMDVSTMITSREPLLEELTREYETSLKGPQTSNIVLGATNIRSFIYGPWQHYASGPLNIITDPSLASAVNAGTLYAQKRAFDSVDPWSLMYTTYYNGKVLYQDIHSDRGSFEINTSANISDTYTELANNGSFCININKGISDSMLSSGTTLEKMDEVSSISVAASDYIPDVTDGWVFNDPVWSTSQPDLIHDISSQIYQADVRAQIMRDGFDQVTTGSSSLSVGKGPVSHSRHSVSWRGSYIASGMHTGALVSPYLWSDGTSSSYSVSLSPSINPPRGSVTSWSVSSATVSLDSSQITGVQVTPTCQHNGNDTTTSVLRTDGYLDQEDHRFDWRVRYDINYKIKTQWSIQYSYSYTYKWRTFEGYTDPVNETGPIYKYHSGSSSGSDSTSSSRTDAESTTHTEIESEELVIIYQQRPPTGGYSGLDTYTDTIQREYHETTVNVNSTDLLDPCCSDAADKYADQHVNIYQIESRYWLYPDNYYLPQHTVQCDVPDWVHRVAADEVLAMLDDIEADGHQINVSMLDHLGQDPTHMRYNAALDLATDLDSYTENYVTRSHYLNGTDLYTSSDAVRYTARNEAYLKLIDVIKAKNQALDRDLDSYLLARLRDSGIDIPGIDLGNSTSASSGSLSLFNNPAIKTAGTALGTEMGIIGTMEVTGMPESKYNWTENMTIVVDQYPDYLYHDPAFDLQGQYHWTDEITGKTIYPLGVRNTCVFTTGIADDIAELLKSSSAPVKTATSQMVSQSIADLNTEVASLEQNLSEQASFDTTALNSNITGLTTTYSSQMRTHIPTEIAQQVAADPVVAGWIDSNNVTAITSGYLNSLTNDAIIDRSTDDTLSGEIASRL